VTFGLAPLHLLCSTLIGAGHGRDPGSEARDRTRRARARHASQKPFVHLSFSFLLTNTHHGRPASWSRQLRHDAGVRARGPRSGALSARNLLRSRRQCRRFPSACVPRYVTIRAAPRPARAGPAPCSCTALTPGQCARRRARPEPWQANLRVIGACFCRRTDSSGR
jgi:hypothetical protein